ncbi:hypothetical protein PTE30175_03293 [Pandoraea terrae]|uniref:Uncharacterized protein n=1 Tax=Pandoraea terrae TaxID=1537710 RepID=A0A5E4WQ16_9BURK|nr:hypothetical protein PTE30175_03293 [Pandoraea terrae]
MFAAGTAALARGSVPPRVARWSVIENSSCTGRALGVSTGWMSARGRGNTAAVA